jgi:hypothetical protein
MYKQLDDDVRKCFFGQTLLYDFDLMAFRKHREREMGLK